MAMWASLRRLGGRRGRFGQRGAVAVLVGLLAVLVLFGMLGIAVDLAYLYARKTELQNAADAAALAGAREINLRQSGIDAAVDAAIAMFALNATDNLIAGTTISAANLRFGSCANPDDRLPLRTPSCAFVDPGSIGSDADAATLSFIEVDTGSAASRRVFFMPILGGPQAAASLGYAVAGHYLHQITPIGVCVVTPTRYDHYAHGELLEYGFRRGVAYDIMALGPLGSNSLPYLVNPVDSDPASCDPMHSSANFTIPFVCTGNSAVGQGAVSGTVYAIGNTGLSNVVVSALNSRFGLYGSAGWGTGQCEPGTAPPDTNVKQYCYRVATGGNSRCLGQQNGSWVPSAVAPHTAYDLDSNNVAQWGTNVPGYQTVQLDSTTKKPCYNASPGGSGTPNRNFAAGGCGPNTGGPNYGVLWSYGPAYRYSALAAGRVGAPFTAAEANQQSRMYNDSATPMTYFGPNPATPTYSASPPYFHNSGTFFQAPTGGGGEAGRRVLNLLLVDCPNVSGAGACGQRLPILGIGRFFMSVLADPTGNKKIEAEFAGLIDQTQQAEIKLYR